MAPQNHSEEPTEVTPQEYKLLNQIDDLLAEFYGTRRVVDVMFEVAE